MSVHIRSSLIILVVLIFFRCGKSESEESSPEERPNNLNRDMAGNIISENIEPMTAGTSIGVKNTSENCAEDRNVSEEVSMGLLKTSIEGKSPRSKLGDEVVSWNYKCKITPTEKGEKYIIRNKKSGEYLKILSQREDVQVTGIRYGNNKNVRKVEFEYSFDITPFGIIWNKSQVTNLSKIPRSGKDQGIATFRRYDDGWRLVNMDY